MKAKILIADDSAYMRSILKDLLLRNGYDVIGEAENGKEVLDIYGKLKPDVVALDIMMPEMSGLEVLEQMQKKGIKVPVIILSNVMSAETRSLAEKYGVKDYIIKSDLTPSQVLEKIQKHLV